MRNVGLRARPLRRLRVSLVALRWKNNGVESSRDYYEVLGVAHGADAKTIKRAFRAKARMLHPDVSADPRADQKFRELAEAYTVLSRPASRLLYDRFGYRGRGVWAAQPASAQAFASLMEFWARATKRPRPAGAIGLIELGFFEAMRGGRRLVRYSAPGPCPACAGAGETCSACSGRGTVRSTDDSGDVVLLQLVRCEECGGSGRLVSESCPQCGGAGEAEQERESFVSIPSGAEDGDRIPLDSDRGAFVVLRVRPQPPDSTLVRAVAAVGLLAALGFLGFLFLA
jgi:molecular chaperone DnaJ